MITLHYSPTDASMAPHIVLCELAAPFTLAKVDRANQAHKQPAYLKMNPNGLIPVLQDGELVLYETAAICMHLADTHPSASLAPLLGSHERAHYMKWMLWLANTLHATLVPFFYPERWADEDDMLGAAKIKAKAQNKVDAMLVQIDEHLARHSGPWFLGEHYSAVDAYAFMLCRWTRSFTSTPARDYAHIGPYLQRMLARAAVQRVYEVEAIGLPWV